MNTAGVPEARAGHPRAPAGGPTPDRAPVPVLLVPGWWDDRRRLWPLERRFQEAGWSADRLTTLEFADPVGGNQEHARTVGRALAELLRRTGADHADVVAHSMGGLALRRHLADTGGTGVRRVVFLATPQRGTWAACLAWGAGGRDMRPGSPFLRRLGAAPPLPPGVRALTVNSRIDLRMLPPSTGRLPGVPDRVVAAGHDTLPADEAAFRHILDFFSDDRS